MRTIVLGAGVVGTTQAALLAQDGRAVTLIDRQPAPGLETSYANGGQISACHTQPWAHPRTLALVLSWLGRADAPLVVRWARHDPALWAWLARFVANCTIPAYDRNMERAVRVAVYSRACLKALRADDPTLGPAYHASTAGILKIYRNRHDYAKGLAAMARTEAWGLHQQALDPAACIDREPALAPVAADLAGGILAPDDEVGDAHLFTRAMAARAIHLGVTFQGETRVLGLEAKGGRVTAVLTDRGRLAADTVILCLGSVSPLIARTLGLRLPIYPAKGYSLTLPLTPDRAAHAPRLSITDEARKMVYARLGDSLRVAGTAELAGWDDLGLTPDRIALLRREAATLFPAIGTFATARPWCGLRPATPDSVPLIGPVPGLPNLILNTGHGTLGWTMACGSARLVTDLLAGRKTDVPLNGLGLDRF